MIGGHKLAALALASLALAAVATALTGAPIFAQQQQATDMKLVDAGFKTRVAINPAEVARLRNYPARTMFVRTKGACANIIMSTPTTANACSPAMRMRTRPIAT